jgi:hypothetical protein
VKVIFGYSRPVMDEMLVENDYRMAAAVPLGTECDTASPPHFVHNRTGERFLPTFRP